MQLIGQVDNINLINSWSKLPNFIIIQGNKNTGKHYFVLYLCEKFGLHYIKVKNTAKEVRNLINVMEPNSNTVYHLEDFDDASLQAKNALLKITEEPIPGNYIIITGGPQIKTLESRARKIIMSPYSFSEVQQLLQKYYSNETEQLKLYNSGINTPAKVEYYKDYTELLEVQKLAQRTFENLTLISPEFIITIMREFEDRYDNTVIDKCMLYLKMLISLIEQQLYNNSYYSYLDILNILLNGKKSLEKEPTLRRKMLIYNMFYQIYSLRSDTQ